MQMDQTTIQLIQVLEKTVSPDKNELEQAKNFLEQAALTNIHEFLRRLSGVLGTTAASTVARMAAGLQLKNQLTSKDPAVKQQFQARWLAIPAETRDFIKKNILGALGTESNRPSSAAQCVAYVAVAELPSTQWTELIPLLVSNIADQNSTEMMKEATLEAIGYICQEIDSEVLVSQSNQILTAIIHGMKGTSTSNHVKLAATKALYNSLEFTKGNFEIESERNFIMEVVCETTQSAHTQIRVAALQCLVKIMSLYYQFMEPYMGPALFPITLEAMRSDSDEVALQGIEFWSNVADEEVDLSMEEGEASEGGRPPSKVSRHYAKGALIYLVPVLIQKLTKQEEFDDEDDWNPSKSAGVCLMLLASCCEESIVPHVLPFVTENIKNPDWRYRDAALMAFGSILGGLESATLKPLVEQAMPTLIELMYDVSVVVRDTAAWTFGRICEIIPEAAINPTYLKPLLESLANGLNAEPRVAANVCWAFTGLAEASYESAEAGEDEQPETYCMSVFFDYIVQRLLETTDRVDGAQANLRSAAYEALMEMVKNSPKDCYVTVQKTTMVILERLQQVLQMETHFQNHSDRAQYHDLQSLLCATLQSVLRKVTPEDAPRIADAIMNALLSMFSSNSGKVGGVQEDALMAVSTLVEQLGEAFLKYMDAFKPFLCLGLKNHAEYQVCGAAVGLTGDICRALKGKMLPYCDEIMTLLLENLGNESVDRSVKPQILAVFGDVALSIGPEFKKYLDVVLQTLGQASQAKVDRSDYDMIDYLNELRVGILEAYTGIIQGFKGENEVPGAPNADVMLLEPHVPFIVQFITSIAQDREHSDEAMSAALGLIGDLVVAFGAKLLPIIETEPLTELITKGRRARVNKAKSLANWVTKEIKKAKNTANSTSSWMHLTSMTCFQSSVNLAHTRRNCCGSCACLHACLVAFAPSINYLWPPHRHIGVEFQDSRALTQLGGEDSQSQRLIRKATRPCTANARGTMSIGRIPMLLTLRMTMSRFDLVCDKAIYPTLGLVALNTGGPIGVYLFGNLNDRIGRRLSFFSCLATLILGGIITSLSNNFWTWAACRMVVGLTIPAIYQIPFIISLELVGPNYRSFVTVMTCTFYTMGLCMLSGVTYLIPAWRTLALVTSTPFLLYFVYWWFLPESPRWLLAKGRLSEASEILQTLAKVNEKELPASFTQKLKQRMTMSRSKSEEERLRTGPGVLSLFKTPNMRLKTCLITLNWFANNMVYVGLSYYGPALGNEEHLSFLFSSLAEIPSYLACWIVMDRWGRRWPLCLCMVTAGLSCVATVLLPSDAVLATLILFLLSKSAISASFLIIYPFAGELYPTQLRGLAIGFSAYISGLGLIIIPFITYLGKENLVLPLVILGAVSVIGGLSGLRLPETLHHRLPQTVEEGELFGKDWKCADCLRCVPIKPPSATTSYEDLSAGETVELQSVSTQPMSEEPRGPATATRRLLMRQSSVMETQRDSDGSIKMTYWF